jgi:ferredoxin-nitrate reductase
MHWGRQCGGEQGRINITTNPTCDPVSKEPDLKFSACQVSPVPVAPRRILVIGGGAATWGFLEHHHAAGLQDRITVFGDEPQPFYDRVQLPHLVDGSRTWDEVVKGDPRAIAERTDGRVDFIPGVAITAIDRQAKTITDALGRHHAYDVLVLATGSRAAKLYQGPMPAQGVHFLRRRGDAEAIRDRAGPGRRAIVIGGGLLGLELADALVEIGTAVTVLQRSERLMGRQLDAKGAAYLAEALTVRGLTIRFKAQVESVVGTEEATGVLLTDGTVLQTDLVVFATGTAPNAELARSAMLACSHGVLVDQHLQTSDPSIYAIGEVADFQSQAAATTAAADGLPGARCPPCPLPPPPPWAAPAAAVARSSCSVSG